MAQQAGGVGTGSGSLGNQFGDTTYTKVFVGGLAWETQRDTMRRHFEQFGDILEAVVITDKNTGRSKGYGFVTFRDAESARKACVDATPIIDGRRANCNLASLGAHRHRPHGQHGPQQGGPGFTGAGSFPQTGSPYGHPAPQAFYPPYAGMDLLNEDTQPLCLTTSGALALLYVKTQGQSRKYLREFLTVLCTNGEQRCTPAYCRKGKAGPNRDLCVFVCHIRYPQYPQDYASYPPNMFQYGGPQYAPQIYGAPSALSPGSGPVYPYGSFTTQPLQGAPVYPGSQYGAFQTPHLYGPTGASLTSLPPAYGGAGTIPSSTPSADSEIGSLQWQALEHQSTLTPASATLPHLESLKIS